MIKSSQVHLQDLRELSSTDTCHLIMDTRTPTAWFFDASKHIQKSSRLQSSRVNSRHYDPVNRLSLFTHHFLLERELHRKCIQMEKTGHGTGHIRAVC